jgi:hypothetical protein
MNMEGYLFFIACAFVIPHPINSAISLMGSNYPQSMYSFELNIKRQAIAILIK